MSCIKCGMLYCICHIPERDLNGTEQALLLMWRKFVERELTDEQEGAPRIALTHLRMDHRLSSTLIELMIMAAREYGHEL